MADKSGYIDGNDTRRTLPHCIVIQKFFLCGPASVFHHFFLQHGQHGVTSPKGEAADSGKGEKQVEITALLHKFTSPLLFILKIS